MKSVPGPDGQRDMLAATKVTGDFNVPAGQPSLLVRLATAEPSDMRGNEPFVLPDGYHTRVDMDAGPQLRVLARFRARGHIAQVSGRRPYHVRATFDR